MTPTRNRSERCNHSGYSDVQLLGGGFFECAQNEYTTKFRAGKYVQGYVCCGGFTKACTVRF